MHRIDTPSATAEHTFTEGSPTGGVPATVVSDDWLNDLQENVCRAVEAAGITLSKGDYNQLLNAIRYLGGQAAAGNFNSLLVGGVDFSIGFKLRWARFSLAAAPTSQQTVLFSSAMNGGIWALTCPDNAALDQIGIVSLQPGSVTVSKGLSDNAVRTGYVVAGGF